MAKATCSRARLADVAAARERARRRRLRWLTAAVSLAAAWLWSRALSGRTVGWPSLSEGAVELLPAIVLVAILGLAVLGPLLGAGRSPHVLYRPSEIDVGLAEVAGAGIIKDEVVRTLNLFLAYKTFRERMGARPGGAILFEGPPGTGKTYMAKAMAAEAGVPYLFVSSSAFQSMYYGQTNRKIRAYFRALRSAARKEAGPSGSSRRSTPSAALAQAWAVAASATAWPAWSTSC